MSMRRAASPLIALVAAAGLAGCGGEEPRAHPPGSPENPLVARTGPTAGSQGSEPGFKSLVERQQAARPGRRFTPCLVSQAQARAILGEPVRLPAEAPQGPTCIYRTQTGDDLVTLAVQRIEFGKVKDRLQQSRRVDVARHTGICGQYGQPMLYVPLSRGRVLTIAAPCGVGRRFAVSAVARLDG